MSTSFNDLKLIASFDRSIFYFRLVSVWQLVGDFSSIAYFELGVQDAFGPGGNSNTQTYLNLRQTMLFKL